MDSEADVQTKKEAKMVSNLPHSGCGGKLKLVVQEPVPAGNPGELFHLYQCDRCQEFVVIGGSKWG